MFCFQESRVDSRGQRLLSQRLRNLRRYIVCRRDIDSLNAHFLSIYESLMPLEEEKAKQKQLLKLLEKLVREEWPEARLFLYGSCANSFGVSKSDIDVCLAIEDTGTKKSEILLKLADILKSDNLQNVQVTGRFARNAVLAIYFKERYISAKWFPIFLFKPDMHSY